MTKEEIIEALKGIFQQLEDDDTETAKNNLESLIYRLQDENV